MNDTQSTQRLASIIKSLRVAMMHTNSPGNGALGAMTHARPMYTQRIDEDRFDGELYFFTDATSRKVQDVQHDPQVVLTYSDPDHHRYVVVYGTATCERNEAKVSELWNLHARGWWPEGPESQALTLIRVNVSGAEYWDGPSNVSYVLQLMKAVATGQRIEGYGEHERLGPA